MTILHEFLVFCYTMIDCHEDLNPVVLIEAFQMCVAFNFSETIMKQEKYKVYIHLAWVVGFHERTKMPNAIEVVKASWYDVDKIFIGFLPN